jgi:hypothetical protein
MPEGRTRRPAPAAEAEEEDGTESGQDKSSAKSSSILLQNLGLLIAGLIAVVVSLRLLAVSTWSRRTALAILQAGGSSSVITGTVLSALGTAVGVAFGLFLVIRTYSLSAERRRPNSKDWLIALIGLLLEILLVPLYLIPATIILLASAFLLGRFGEHLMIRDRRLTTVGYLSLAGMTLAAIGFVVMDHRPWLPAENIRLGGGAVVTGYVLRNDPEDLALLQGKRPRHVVHIIDPQIISREVCGGTSKWWDIPIFKNLLGLSQYPECVGPH